MRLWDEILSLSVPARTAWRDRMYSLRIVTLAPLTSVSVQSFRRRVAFQWFLTAFSVRPGMFWAITARRARCRGAGQARRGSERGA